MTMTKKAEISSLIELKRKGLFRDEISNMSLFNGVADDITKIMTIGFKREIGGYPK